LLDRASFDADIARDVEQALRMPNPLALVFVDIDHFKCVNDTHGHQKGDAVLRGVTGRITAVAQGKGAVYRYGGEEIVLVLPNHTTEEAIAVAERARREIENQPFDGVAVTASFGLGVLGEHATTCAELIKAADAAVYDAKNRGRNLVRVFGEPEPPKAGPREPKRRKPEPGRLTEKQRSQMRSNHFQGCRIVCPEDGAILDVRELNTMGSATRGLLIYCPMCGLNEGL